MPNCGFCHNPNHNFRNCDSIRALEMKNDMKELVKTFAECYYYVLDSGPFKLFYCLNNLYNFMSLKVGFVDFKINMVTNSNQVISCDLTSRKLRFNYQSNKTNFLIQIIEEIIHQLKTPNRLTELEHETAVIQPAPRYMSLNNVMITSFGERFLCSTITDSNDSRRIVFVPIVISNATPAPAPATAPASPTQTTPETLTETLTETPASPPSPPPRRYVYRTPIVHGGVHGGGGVQQYIRAHSQRNWIRLRQNQRPFAAPIPNYSTSPLSPLPVRKAIIEHKIEKFTYSLNECPICYEEEEMKKAVVKTNCQHLFCKCCFDKVIETCDTEHVHCPMCRSVVSNVVECIA